MSTSGFNETTTPQPSYLGSSLVPVLSRRPTKYFAGTFIFENIRSTNSFGTDSISGLILSLASIGPFPSSQSNRLYSISHVLLLSTRRTIGISGLDKGSGPASSCSSVQPVSRIWPKNQNNTRPHLPR